MKTKKYQHADLENKRSIFFQIGLIVALGAALAAFEWSSNEAPENTYIEGEEFIPEEEMMPIVKPEKKDPVPKKVFMPEILIITDETDDLGDEPDFTSEATSDTEVHVPDFVEENHEDDVVHIRVEVMPEYPGGTDALMRYVAQHIKYPALCAEIGIQGKVYVSFVVDKDGSVTNVSILRSPDANLSAEAVRVVSSLPRWTPGRQNGKPVKVSYNIPVNFRLQ